MGENAGTLQEVLTSLIGLVSETLTLIIVGSATAGFAMFLYALIQLYQSTARGGSSGGAMGWGMAMIVAVGLGSVAVLIGQISTIFAEPVQW